MDPVSLIQGMIMADNSILDPSIIYCNTISLYWFKMKCYASGHSCLRHISQFTVSQRHQSGVSETCNSAPSPTKPTLSRSKEATNEVVLVFLKQTSKLFSAGLVLNHSRLMLFFYVSFLKKLLNGCFVQLSYFIANLDETIYFA